MPLASIEPDQALAARKHENRRPAGNFVDAGGIPQAQFLGLVSNFGRAVDVDAYHVTPVAHPNAAARFCFLSVSDVPAGRGRAQQLGFASGPGDARPRCARVSPQAVVNQPERAVRGRCQFGNAG